MVAPALTSIASEFNISNEVELSLTLSIFVLAYAVGPLFLGPLSEIYGRTIVIQTANILYLFFNLNRFGRFKGFHLLLLFLFWLLLFRYPLVLFFRCLGVNID